MKNGRSIKCILMMFAIMCYIGSAAFADTIEADNIKGIDYAQLETTKDNLTVNKLDITGFPNEILELQGQKVKVTGYFSLPVEDFYDPKPVSKFAVLRYAYGCPCCNWGQNPPPTIFNTILVDLKQGKTIDPPYSSRVDVIGTFVATKEYNNDEHGVKTISKLYYIKDAEASKIDPGWLGILGSMFGF